MYILQEKNFSQGFNVFEIQSVLDPAGTTFRSQTSLTQRGGGRRKREKGRVGGVKKKELFITLLCFSPVQIGDRRIYRNFIYYR